MSVVVIDGRPLVGHRTGIGVHTAEIARRLDPPPLIASHAEIDDKTGIERCAFRVDGMPYGVLWQQLVLPKIARDGVLWGPHGTIPLTLRTPSVITLHDFTALTMPRRHRLQTILSFDLFIGRSVQRATRIAAVSRAVAEEAKRWFGVSCAIVPNGVDDFFTPDGGGEEDDFILFAGTIEPRKGVDDLLDVWSSLPSPRPRLVLAGDAGWGVRASRPHRSGVSPDRDRGEDRRAGRPAGAGGTPALQGVDVTGYVTRERLRELYRRARLFVYPSRYEGFGIPPLEAMACGAAVIATRTGAIPDYAEGAALLVEPGDLDALRAAMVRALASRALRDELRARGAERAAKWRWNHSAMLMSELLAEAGR
jgi:glycosyltransferase involved in cell wall biosynthesis